MKIILNRFSGMGFFRYPRFLGLLILLQTTRCKEVYVPPNVPLNSSFLVVDGMLFSGNDTSAITLSRSRNLADSIPTVYELNAQVSVVNGSGIEYPFTDKGNGQYIIGKLDLDNTQKYQLKIITTDGNLYLSDSVEVRTTPPIDSIQWTQDPAGVHIFLNTGDPQNNTRYYRWEYMETWEYQTAFQSLLDYVDGQAVFRTAADQVYTCYSNSYSSDINVGTTDKLSQDIINQQPITTVATGSEKISREYSLLIKQYALTQDAYIFWQNLRANSQNLGSLFDMQPFTQLGNLHCVNNPVIPVIGYVSFCTLQQKRTFIGKNDVIAWNYMPYYGSCYIMSNSDLSVLFPTGPPYFYTLTGTDITTYLYSTSLCADCRAHGGTTRKPTFMP